MKSKNLIKKIKDETQLNNKQIAEIVGKSPPTISRYLNGEEIPTEVIHILTDKFGIEKSQEYSCELNNVEIYEVSKRTGISEHFIRLGLQQGVLPFGYAIRGDGKAYQYWIFRGAFERFMEQNK